MQKTNEKTNTENERVFCADSECAFYWSTCHGDESCKKSSEKIQTKRNVK